MKYQIDEMKISTTFPCVHIKSLQLYSLISFKSIAMEQSKKNDIIW
jgi:hypothetical protein